MNNFIVFNPNCTKCNLTQGIVESLDDEFKIINYLEGELDASTAMFIFNNIADRSSLLRSDKTPQTHEEFFSLIQSNPIDLQRPIVNYNNNVFINRPADVFNQYLK